MPGPFSPLDSHSSFLYEQAFVKDSVLAEKSSLHRFDVGRARLATSSHLAFFEARKTKFISIIPHLTITLEK